MTPEVVAPPQKPPTNVLIHMPETKPPSGAIVDGPTPDMVKWGDIAGFIRKLGEGLNKPIPGEQAEQTSARQWFEKVVGAINDAIPEQKPEGNLPWEFNMSGGPTEAPKIPPWVAHAVNDTTKDSFASAAEDGKSFAAGPAALKAGKAALALFKGAEVDVTRDPETGNVRVSGKVKAGIGNHVWSVGISWNKGKVEFNVGREKPVGPK
ncbi:MAG: hypothetical protein ABH950_02980 [Candidatus Altiarchaeota archaeon]